jgi:lysophospholipase L1-like esterase
MRILLLGDSIRIDYQPRVAAILGKKAQVIGPEQNCGDSRCVLACLADWLAGEPPDVVHINFGLHDLKLLLATGEHQVPLEEYARNVPAALAKLRALAPAARLIWATTTPVRDERYVNRKEFTRSTADVDRYNAAALVAAKASGYEIDDLHAIVMAAGKSAAVCDDGVHMTELGSKVLAEAVARSVMEK